MQNVSICWFKHGLSPLLNPSGQAPFFTISLLLAGFSSFKVLAPPMGNSFTYLGRFSALCWARHSASAGKTGNGVHPQPAPAATSFSPVIAYQNIASGVASTIHHVSAGRGTGHDGLFRRKRGHSPFCLPCWCH